MTEIVADRTIQFIGDTHFTIDTEDIRNTSNDLLAADIDTASIPEPVVRIQVGDLVDTGESAEDAVAIAYFTALGGDWWAAAGNHDVGSQPGPEKRSFEDFATSLGYASPNYVQDYMGDLGVKFMFVAPSGDQSAVGPLESSTLDWMHAELQANPTDPYIVVCHRPLYNSADPTGSHSYSNSTSSTSRYQSPRTDLDAVLAANGNVVAYASGHIHPRIDAPNLWMAYPVGDRTILHLCLPATWQAGNASLGNRIEGKPYTFWLKVNEEGDGFESMIVRDHDGEDEFEAGLPETDWVTAIEPDFFPTAAQLASGLATWSGTANNSASVLDGRVQARENLGLGNVSTYDLGDVGGPPLLVIKGADESVTTSTTLQDDDELVLPVGANEVWFLEGNLMLTGSTAGDLKVGWSGPSGASALWDRFVETGPSTITPRALLGVGDTVDIAGRSGLHSGAVRGWFTSAGTGGNFTLRWAQNTSDGTATVIKAGSFLRCTRLS